eukprot:9576104-Alexandrium_andersonii.AAC.1
MPCGGARRGWVPLAALAAALAPVAPGGLVCAMALVPVNGGEPTTWAWCAAAAIRKRGDRC